MCPCVHLTRQDRFACLTIVRMTITRRLTNIIDALMELRRKHGDLEYGHNDGIGMTRVELWEDVESGSGAEAGLLAEGDWNPSQMARC